MTPRKNTRIALVLCVVSAVLYNSWPLGYVLNSQTAHVGFASLLEVAGQPHYLLFVWGDILSGASLITSAFIWFGLGPARKAYTLTSLGLALFGLSTALAAVLPLFNGFVIDHFIGLDAIFSILSYGGILLSLVGLCKLKLGAFRLKVTQATLLAWFVSGLLVAAFYATGGDIHLSQQIFLVLTGVAVIVGGLGLNDALHRPRSL